MSQQTATGFSKAALDQLNGSPSASLLAARRRAFEQFEAMPTPSPDTEEWRYTDLREFDLSFDPYAPEPPATTLDDWSAGCMRPTPSAPLSELSAPVF